MPRKNLPWLLVLGFALLFLSTFFTKSHQAPLPSAHTSTSPVSSTPDPSSPLHIVTRVIDGDTIELSDKTKVRYIGIDTQESGDCFGTEAKQANTNLVLNKEIRLEYDVQRLDKYTRTLAYVYVGEVFVNEKLVQDGFAKVATFPPNILYINKFIEAERQARENSLGLWSQEVCKLSFSSAKMVYL